ncbi:MAG: hypothetical protein ABIT05_05585 [Chitinophagaceae bacterium]
MKALLSVLAMAIMILGTSWITPVRPGKSKGVIKTTNTPAPNFAFFRTHHQGRGITATWGLDQNSGVSGFIVQKTYEDPGDPYSTWDNICSMNCGNERSFKHEDMNVSPGFISYRVIGFLMSGGTIMSMISTERIVSH